MRCRTADTTWLWNTGQGKKLLSVLLLLAASQTCVQSDFIDSMSRQFFGTPDNNGPSGQQQYHPTADPFSQMFGSASQPVPQRPHAPPPRIYQSQNPHRQHPPQRQGYYAPANVPLQQAHPYPPYNGPPPVYGQQQGFGQRRPDSNETKTEGYPPDKHKHPQVHAAQHYQQEVRHYQPVDYQVQHHNQQAAVVEYHKPPATVVEYQTPNHHHLSHPAEYHHLPPQTENHSPTLEIHPGPEHTYHETPGHVEYHAPPPPQIEYHHYTTHKPKRFSISFNKPSPDYAIIDRHIKLPPVKFRFHINPKIVITSNTKDPLDKKHHHDEEHDLEPYPPPDAFSDPDAVPQFNKHIIEHYPVKHHYPVEHHVTEHVALPQAKHAYPVEHHVTEHVLAIPQAKHAYPANHHVVEHHPNHEYTYDLSHGHSHLNPHRSLGHYEPTFKIKTKPIIFTEPAPTRPTTTTTTARPTPSTARTTTTRRTTTRRTTRRPRTTRRTTTTTAATTTTTTTTSRARISARNPAFSVAFTEGSTTVNATNAPTTTRRSIFSTNTERERESGGVISARRDEISTSAEAGTSTRSTTTANATSKPTTLTVSTSTSSVKPTTLSLTTTTTTTTQKPTTVVTTTTTTQKPTTVVTTTTTTQKPTTVVTTTTQKPTTTTTRRPTTTSSTTRPTPAEETTRRTTTLSADTNEIDMRKATNPPRRRPEPLQDVSPSSVERSETVNFEASESVKVIETTMLIDGKNQTVRFYYITQPVKLPLDVFRKMTGQSGASGMNVIKIRDRRFVRDPRQGFQKFD